MARAVNGFLAGDGTFYDTEEKAQLHEAVYTLADAFFEEIKNFNLTEDNKKVFFEGAKAFIWDNRNAITSFIENRRAIEGAEKAVAYSSERATKPAIRKPDAGNRQLPDRDQDDDPRVRPEPSYSMVEPSSPEDYTPNIGDTSSSETGLLSDEPCV